MLPSDLDRFHRDFQEFGNRTAHALDNFPKLLGIFVDILKKFLNSRQKLLPDLLHRYRQIVFQLVEAFLGGVSHGVVGLFCGSRAVLHFGKNIVKIQHLGGVHAACLQFFKAFPRQFFKRIAYICSRGVQLVEHGLDLSTRLGGCHAVFGHDGVLRG